MTSKKDRIKKQLKKILSVHFEMSDDNDHGLAIERNGELLKVTLDAKQLMPISGLAEPAMRELYNAFSARGYATSFQDQQQSLGIGTLNEPVVEVQLPDNLQSALFLDQLLRSVTRNEKGQQSWETRAETGTDLKVKG